MPANIDSMMSVREMPWHREGQVLEDYPGSWEEARKFAGLEWDPYEAPVFVQTGYEEPAPALGPDSEPLPSFTSFTAEAGPYEEPVYEQLDEWKAVLRSDNKRILAVTRDSRALITNGAMGEIIEAVLDMPGVKYETAGSLDEGRAVWCLAYLDEPIVLPGDKSVTLPYLAVTNRHVDGGVPLRATAVRIVCANTFREAELEGERTGATYTFRHTRNWRDRIEDARNAVTGARSEIAEYTEMATHLLGIKVTHEQRELFVKAFVPSPPETMISDRVARNVEEARAAVRGILNGETTDGISYTAYGLVQAAGEYLDHIRRSNSWESKLNRTLLRPEPAKHQALKIVRELVSA